MPPGPSLKGLSCAAQDLLCCLSIRGKPEGGRLVPNLPLAPQLIYVDLHGLISCPHAHGFSPMCLPGLSCCLCRDKEVCSTPHGALRTSL